jgi:hypothetical protein
MNLTDPQQWHGYTYANNNPLTWSDPTGLEPRPWHNSDYKPSDCAGSTSGECNPGKNGYDGYGKKKSSPGGNSKPTSTGGGQSSIHDLVSGSDTGPAERDDPQTYDVIAYSMYGMAYDSLDLYEQEQILIETWCYNNPRKCEEYRNSLSDPMPFLRAAWNNRGTILTVGATIPCMVSVAGWGACASWQGIALGVRTEQRIAENGFTATADEFVADAIYTTASTAVFRIPWQGTKYTGSGAIIRRPGTLSDEFDMMTPWRTAVITGAASVPAATRAVSCVLEPGALIC